MVNINVLFVISGIRNKFICELVNTGLDFISTGSICDLILEPHT